MRRLYRLAWLVAAACISLTASAPEVAMAVETLLVEHNPANGRFATIQAALNRIAVVRSAPANANDSFIVRVRADDTPYTQPFTPISNVQIVGDSTAGTFLSGAGTLVSLSGVQDVTIGNFTFRSSSVGISVANSASITIRNNVFNLGAAGTAVRITDSPSTLIVNNTFASNGTAISANSAATITNNIFFGNTTAIAAPTTAPVLKYNYFFGNVDNGLPLASLGFGSIPNQQAPTAANPLFVDTGNRDFHLQAGSPAANSGDPGYRNSFNNSFDRGAYGGPSSDITLAPVTNLNSELLSSSSIELKWDPTSIGAATAYRVYYNTSSRVDDPGSPFAPLLVPIGTNTATLTSLPGPAAAPQAPTLAAPVSLNQALQLSWSQVPAATGYRIYYSTVPFTAANPPTTPTPIVLDQAATSHTLGSLTNGATYFVAVEALAQTEIFAAVTAVVDGSLDPRPGTANESALSNAASEKIGPLAASGISGAPLSGSPEAISPYPDLKNEGCFIATAAFGFYSAPQVQALRDFRDSCLLTNAPGRAFVAWYYRCGPGGADFINAHPWLKPPVRLALLPLVVGSAFLLHAPPLAQAAILLLAIALSTLLLQRIQRKRKLPMHPGGSR